MNDRADRRAEEAIAKVRMERRNDGRLTRRHEGGRGKAGLWRVACIRCGTELATGTDLDYSLALAGRNAKLRPCCKLWESDENVTDYWRTDR